MIKETSTSPRHIAFAMVSEDDRNNLYWYLDDLRAQNNR